MPEQEQVPQVESPTATAKATLPPTPNKKVVVCTPTYNRRFCLDFSVECFRRQTYPNLHWVIVDNSSDDENSWKDIQQEEGLSITYVRILEKKTIGRLRNIMMEEALKHDPDYIAFWDDDDYYVPGRILTSVNALENNPKYDIVGCEIMSVFLTRENILMDVGPYGRNHATAATYVFRAECARTRYFLETASKAEESTFTRDWTLEMIMLPAKQIMLVLGHSQNTVNKSEIFVDPRKFGSRMNNADNAKNIVRFQWIQDPNMWAVFRKTFLDV